jgi:hypothetical protein
METAASGASRPMSATADVQPKGTSRLLFVDNIRVSLTILVLLHHGHSVAMEQKIGLRIWNQSS